MIKHLDLGCGENIFDIKNITNLSAIIDISDVESYGVDFLSNKENIVSADLSMEGIPFEDNTFDIITCLDFLEHIPRINLTNKTNYPFINLMNDIYRVLKSEGILFIKTPVFNENFFDDPTHINPITPNLLYRYFCTSESEEAKKPMLPWARSYGFTGSFKFVNFSKTERINFEDHIFVLSKD